MGRKALDIHPNKKDMVLYHNGEANGGLIRWSSLLIYLIISLDIAAVISLVATLAISKENLLGLWFDSPLLATILATGGISIFGDSSL
jgi:hypothetical protein